MILDNNLVFSNAQSLAVSTTTASTTTIDLTGGSSLNIGNGSTFGADMGIGDGVAMPKIAAYIGTALQTANSATLNIQFQGSTDSSTWTTYVETGALAASVLVAGAKVAAFDWPLKATGAAMPRYIRLNYNLPNATAFTTGTITAAIVLQRDDWTAGLYPAGFTVGN